MKRVVCVLACLLAVASVHAEGLLFVHGHGVLGEEAVFSVQGCSLSVAAGGDSWTVWTLPEPGPVQPYVLGEAVTRENFTQHLAQALRAGADPVEFSRGFPSVVDRLVVLAPYSFQVYFHDDKYPTNLTIAPGATGESAPATVESIQMQLSYAANVISKCLAEDCIVFISQSPYEYGKPVMRVYRKDDEKAQVTLELDWIRYGRNPEVLDKVVLLKDIIPEIRNPK